MTPELRAALAVALTDNHWQTASVTLDAIAPIIDAANKSAEHSGYRKGVEDGRAGALLAAADDLEAISDRFDCEADAGGLVSDWLRARADQITDVPGA